MGLGEKYRLHAGFGSGLVQPPRMVALRTGTFLLYVHCAQSPLQVGMPVLYKQESASRFQRSCDRQATPCRAMGSGTERDADAADGDNRQPSEGLVEVPGWPPLESGGLLPRRCAGERLPGLRRKNAGAQYKMVTILEMPVRLRQGNHCRATPATSRKETKSYGCLDMYPQYWTPSIGGTYH